MHFLLDGLESLGLLAQHSQVLIQKIKSLGLLRAIKACGAMGADVLFLFFDKGHGEKVKSFVKELGLDIIGDELSLSEGLKVSVEPNREITKGPWL